MFNLSRTLLSWVPLIFSLTFSQNLLAQTHSPDSFDAPLKKEILDLGPSPYYMVREDVRIKLSCYFYPTFIVKEYNKGQKGAEWLAIAPRGKNGKPGCALSHVPGERVIEAGEWSGYFKGVSGNQVFFRAADGTDGGLPFVVYDSTTGRRIFEDSAYDSTMWTEKVQDSPFDRLRIDKAPDGQMSLRYLRVVEASCDLHSDKTACWERAQNRFDLKNIQMPVCSGYERVRTRLESAIAYPVLVTLFPKPAVKTITGPVKCWPVD